ncbi:unnamed protein product [Spodoptera littoralis]|uniref:ascorbate ferrireductase (transmembrane) n=1 Tax=Spodoptera littoralis TaxID=7109 RepID=A0A9P0N3I9_SPOLI|nr:unnamed protein product [Spodoptera littoralis]CAH1640268.1 unnamed protein product [Spodoptera littoralis]
MSSPPKVSFYVGCMNATYTVAHILMGGAVFLTFALADLNENSLYKAHVCTTIIGVTLLCSQAVLSVNPYVGFEDNFMYPQKSKTYWLIQILGSALVLSGACIGIASVGEKVSAIDDFPFPIPDIPGLPGLPGAKHLQTDHGIIGCMNAINTVAHILMGGALFLTFVLADGNDPALYKAHACMSILGVTLLCSQAVLSVNPYVGFEDNFMYPQKSKTYWLIQILGSVLVLIGACIGIALVSETSFGFELPFPTPGLVLVQHLQTSHGIIDGEDSGRLKAHACTTAIGITILCSQAVLSVNPYVGFEDNFMYPHKSKLYWIIQIIGSGLVACGACVGVALVYENSSNILPIPTPIPVQFPTRHLQNAHTIVGSIPKFFHKCP